MVVTRIPWWVVVSGGWRERVKDDSLRTFAAALGGRDVERLRGRRQESPERGGGAMTQRGLGPASQRGGETARLEGQAGVADGIDAAVDAVQPPGPHPRRDRAVAHSQLGEL